MPDHPPPDHNLLQYMLAAGMAAGTFILGLMAALGFRRKSDGDDKTPNGITKYDLLMMRRQIDGDSSEWRKALYEKMDHIAAEYRLDMRRLEDTIAEYVTANEVTVRTQEKELGERMRVIELAQARAEKRSGGH